MEVSLAPGSFSAAQPTTATVTNMTVGGFSTGNTALTWIRRNIKYVSRLNLATC
jgi:hypothetical protein